MPRDPYTGLNDADAPLFAAAPRSKPALPGVARTVLSSLGHYIDAWGDEPTSAELAQWMQLDHKTVARALAELRGAGKADHSDTRQSRAGGEELATWRMT